MKKILFIIFVVIVISLRVLIILNYETATMAYTVINPLWCHEDTDCTDSTVSTTCYHDCKIFDDCKNIPKCEIRNISIQGPICAISSPCQKPKSIECVKQRCLADW